MLLCFASEVCAAGSGGIPKSFSQPVGCLGTRTEESSWWTSRASAAAAWKQGAELLEISPATGP